MRDRATTARSLILVDLKLKFPYKQAMKRILALALFLLIFSIAKAHACGHEGTYAGLGYTQLFQFSPDRQLVATGGTSPKVNWNSRWGAHLRLGHDFCQSRWGVEFPFSFDRQRLNRNEFINQIGIDSNSYSKIVPRKSTGSRNRQIFDRKSVKFIILKIFAPFLTQSNKVINDVTY